MATINYIDQKIRVTSVSTKSCGGKSWGHNRQSRFDVSNHEPISVRWHEILIANDFVFDDVSEDYKYKNHVFKINGTECSYRNKIKIVRGTWNDMILIIRKIRGAKYVIRKPVHTESLKSSGTPIKASDKSTWLNHNSRDINNSLLQSR